MGSPLYPLGLIALYLYIVKVAGPQYMKNRPAYQLSGIISLYNVTQIVLNATLFVKVSTRIYIRLCLKCDGTRAENRFRLSANGRVHLNRRGASAQSTICSRGVCISGNNAGYTIFRGSMKSTGYALHSSVSPSLPLSCITVCHHIATGLYTKTSQCY